MANPPQREKGSPADLLIEEFLSVHRLDRLFGLVPLTVLYQRISLHSIDRQ